MIMLSEFNYDLSNIDDSVYIYLYDLHSNSVDKSNLFVLLQQKFNSAISMDKLIDVFHQKM